MKLEVFIKKIVIIAEVIALLFAFIGCSRRRSTLYTEKKGDEIANELVNIFVTEDRETLKTLLTEDALSTSDLDEGIDYCFKLLPSEVLSVEKVSLSLSEHLGRGEAFQMGRGYYKISTTEEIYSLTFEYIFVDEQNSCNNEKIQRLKLVVQSDKEKEFYIPINGHTTMGIYNPQWDARDLPIVQKDRAEVAIKTILLPLVTENADELKRYLSVEALQTIDLDVGINYMFQLFPEKYYSYAKENIEIKELVDEEGESVIVTAVFRITAENPFEEFELSYEYIAADSRVPENNKTFRKIKLVKANDDNISIEDYSNLGIYNPEWDKKV